MKRWISSLVLFVALVGLLGSGTALAYTNPYTGIQHDSWA